VHNLATILIAIRVCVADTVHADPCLIMLIYNDLSKNTQFLV